MGLPFLLVVLEFPLLLSALRGTLQVPLCFDVPSENRKSGRRAASFFLCKDGFGRGVEGPS